MNKKIIFFGIFFIFFSTDLWARNFFAIRNPFKIKNCTQNNNPNFTDFSVLVGKGIPSNKITEEILIRAENFTDYFRDFESRKCDSTTNVGNLINDRKTKMIYDDYVKILKDRFRQEALSNYYKAKKIDNNFLMDTFEKEIDQYLSKEDFFNKDKRENFLKEFVNKSKISLDKTKYEKLKAKVQWIFKELGLKHFVDNTDSKNDFHLGYVNINNILEGRVDKDYYSIAKDHFDKFFAKENSTSSPLNPAIIQKAFFGLAVADLFDDSKNNKNKKDNLEEFNKNLSTASNSPEAHLLNSYALELYQDDSSKYQLVDQSLNNVLKILDTSSSPSSKLKEIVENEKKRIRNEDPTLVDEDKKNAQASASIVSPPISTAVSSSASVGNNSKQDKATKKIINLVEYTSFLKTISTDSKTIDKIKEKKDDHVKLLPRLQHVSNKAIALMLDDQVSGGSVSNEKKEYISALNKKPGADGKLNTQEVFEAYSNYIKQEPSKIEVSKAAKEYSDDTNQPGNYCNLIKKFKDSTSAGRIKDEAEKVYRICKNWRASVETDSEDADIEYTKLLAAHAQMVKAEYEEKTKLTIDQSQFNPNKPTTKDASAESVVKLFETICKGLDHVDQLQCNNNQATKLRDHLSGKNSVSTASVTSSAATVSAPPIQKSLQQEVDEKEKLALEQLQKKGYIDNQNREKIKLSTRQLSREFLLYKVLGDGNCGLRAANLMNERVQIANDLYSHYQHIQEKDRLGFCTALMVDLEAYKEHPKNKTAEAISLCSGYLSEPEGLRADKNYISPGTMIEIAKIKNFKLNIWKFENNQYQCSASVIANCDLSDNKTINIVYRGGSEGHYEALVQNNDLERRKKAISEESHLPNIESLTPEVLKNLGYSENAIKEEIKRLEEYKKSKKKNSP